MANTIINTPELLNLDSTTGATILAKGTVNERPPTPTFGVDYLVVAGGGGGGGGVTSESPGAGGAGAVIYQAAGLNVIPSGEYTLYIANGGAGGGNNSQGSNGQDSYISFGGSNVVLAKGGGGGGSYSGPGLDGGSGGGGTRDGDTNSSQAGGSAVTTNIAPAGASIYGNNGASGTGSGGSAGGGGGAGEAGNTDGAGTGGDGIQINIDGNNYYWGGGGGAGGSAGTGGQGGGGGGPRGGQGGTGGINPGGSTGSTADGGGNGGANTGGGGGGATNPTGYPGGTGGSGIIILRYPNNFTLVVGAGSLSTGQLNTAIGSDEKYTSFTGGTGTISFSGTVVGGENDATDGALRFNTETNKTEYFDGANWYEIVDEYANGYDGIPTNYFDTKLYTGNGGTQSIGGYINGSGSFNGSSSRIDLPNNILPNNSTASSSCSFWFKSSSGNSAGDSETIIDAWSYNTSEPGWGLFMEPAYGGFPSGGLYLANYYLGGTSSGTGNVTFRDGNWHFGVVVLDFPGGTIKVYIDGNPTPVISQTVSSSNVDVFTTNAAIGYQNANSSYPRYFNGAIDQVRIYSDALTTSEIAYLHANENSTTAGQLNPSGFPTNCVVAYTMDTGAADVNNTYNGTATNVNFNGHLDFAPGLTWIKARDAAHDHLLVDSVNGAGSAKGLASNATYYEGQYTATYGYISSLNSNGFTVAAGSSYANYTNVNNEDYVSWSWKAGGTAVTNNDGTISSQVTANKDSGFSIVSYTGTGVVSDTVGHGLTNAELIFVKNLDGNTNWIAWNKDFPANSWAYLNAGNTPVTSDDDGGIKNVDADTFGFINGAVDMSAVNNSGDDYIAYVWKSITGYSDIGKYTGTGGVNTITTGFQPSWVMIRRYNTGNKWVVFDNKREVTGVLARIQLNTSAAESVNAANSITITSTGFSMDATQDGFQTNKNNLDYIYMAIA